MVTAQHIGWVKEKFAEHSPENELCAYCAIAKPSEQLTWLGSDDDPVICCKDCYDSMWEDICWNYSIRY